MCALPMGTIRAALIWASPALEARLGDLLEEIVGARLQQRFLCMQAFFTVGM